MAARPHARGCARDGLVGLRLPGACDPSHATHPSFYLPLPSQPPTTLLSPARSPALANGLRSPTATRGTTSTSPRLVSYFRARNKRRTRSLATLQITCSSGRAAAATTSLRALTWHASAIQYASSRQAKPRRPPRLPAVRRPPARLPLTRARAPLPTCRFTATSVQATRRAHSLASTRVASPHP